MKFLKQINLMNILYTTCVIGSIYYLGQWLSELISGFIVMPGNIIGMGILFLLLQLKIVNFNRIKQTGDFILKHFSLFFIPFGVSILKYYPMIKDKIVVIVGVITLATIMSLIMSVLVAKKVGE